MTTKTAREKFEHLIDFEMQVRIEGEVTAYIKANLSFSILEIIGKSQRLSAEEALLSTLAQCPDCRASKQWLGRHHPRQAIQEMGLWNVQGLRGEALSIEGVESFFEG